MERDKMDQGGSDDNVDNSRQRSPGEGKAEWTNQPPCKSVAGISLAATSGSSVCEYPEHSTANEKRRDSCTNQKKRKSSAQSDQKTRYDDDIQSTRGAVEHDDLEDTADSADSADSDEEEVDDYPGNNSEKSEAKLLDQTGSDRKSDQARHSSAVGAIASGEKRFREERRLAMNRHKAKARRKREKDMIQELQSRVIGLAQQNQELWLHNKLMERELFVRATTNFQGTLFGSDMLGGRAALPSVLQQQTSSAERMSLETGMRSNVSLQSTNSLVSSPTQLSAGRDAVRDIFPPTSQTLHASSMRAFGEMPHHLVVGAGDTTGVQYPPERASALRESMGAAGLSSQVGLLGFASPRGDAHVSMGSAFPTQRSIANQRTNMADEFWRLLQHPREKDKADAPPGSGINHPNT